MTARTIDLNGARRRSRVAAVAGPISVAVLMALAACSDSSTDVRSNPGPGNGGNGGNGGPTDAPVVSVAVSPTPVELSVGETRTLAAAPRDSAGNVLSKPVAWRSADTTIASVDTAGNVKALKVGSVAIVASSGGKEGSASVNVVSVPEIILSAGSASIVSMAGALSPAPQQVQVANHGTVSGLALDVTYATGQPTGWLTAALTGPDAPASLNLKAETGLLPAAAYRATVRIRAARTDIVAKQVDVVFDVKPRPTIATVTDRHSCALTRDAEVFCWGYNNNGQAIVSADQLITSPTRVDPSRRFVQVSSGMGFTCALHATGKTYCWGTGYLGGGSANTRGPITEVVGPAFVSIAAGYRHTCGLTAAGEAYCWGVNGSGQVGDGSTTDRPTPVRVAGGLVFASLTLGENHTCGLTSNGLAYCWGSGADGRLGTGATADAKTPAPVSGGLTFTQIEAGKSHTCGAATNGSAYCWGYNGNYQLGDGTATSRSLPTQVSLSGRIAFVSGGDAESCALTTSGEGWCWGYRFKGSLGDGLELGSRGPVRVLVSTPMHNLGVGNAHVCAADDQDGFWCWGMNQNGALGDGSTADRLTPYSPRVK